MTVHAGSPDPGAHVLYGGPITRFVMIWSPAGGVPTSTEYVMVALWPTPSGPDQLRIGAA